MTTNLLTCRFNSFCLVLHRSRSCRFVAARCASVACYFSGLNSYYIIHRQQLYTSLCVVVIRYASVRIGIVLLRVPRHRDISSEIVSVEISRYSFLADPSDIIRHHMMTSSNGNTFRVTAHLCGEFTGPGEFPSQKPVAWSFDVFFDLRPNKRLSKQWWGWLYETPSCPLWRHCNDSWWNLLF